MAKVSIDLDEITCHFDELEDPRSSINQRHPFVSVVAQTIEQVAATVVDRVLDLAGFDISTFRWGK